MREIKFRALELDTGRIVYGYYVVEPGYWMSNGAPDLSKPVTRHYIVNDGVKHDVLEASAQQFTGLKDVNGTDIYEGDIVAMPYIDPMGGISYVNDFLSDVIFERGCFQVWCNELKPERHNIENWIERAKGEYKSNYGNVYNWGDCMLTVIGNIYENQELIKLT